MADLIPFLQHASDKLPSGMTQLLLWMAFGALVLRLINAIMASLAQIPENLRTVVDEWTRFVKPKRWYSYVLLVLSTIGMLVVTLWSKLAPRRFLAYLPIGVGLLAVVFIATQISVAPSPRIDVWMEVESVLLEMAHGVPRMASRESMEDILSTLLVQASTPYQRGLAQVGLSKYDEAILSFDSVLAKASIDSLEYGKAHLFKGVAHSLSTRDTLALESYERAIVFRHDYAEALFGRGLCQARLGLYDKAIESFEEALSHPHGPDLWYWFGMTLSEVGKYQEAWAKFDSVITLQPAYAAGWLGRAKLCFEAELTSTDLDTALSLDVTWGDAWQLAAFEAADRRDTVSAFAFLEAASRYGAHSVDESLNLGVVLTKLGEVDKAYDVLTNITEDQQAPVRAWYYKALILLEMEDYGQARHCFGMALTSNRRNSETWIGLGVTYARLGMPDSAIACMDSAVVYAANSPAVWLDRTLALYEAGLLEQANAALDSAALYGGSDSLFAFRLAQGFRHLGRYAEAHASLSKSLALHPEWTEARALQQILEKQLTGGS